MNGFGKGRYPRTPRAIEERKDTDEVQRKTSTSVGNVYTYVFFCHRTSISMLRNRDRESKENVRDRSRHRDSTGYRDNGSGGGREWQRGDFGVRDSSREANNRDGGGGGGGGAAGRRGPAPLKGLHDELGAYGEIVSSGGREHFVQRSRELVRRLFNKILAATIP